jgi:transcriptional regulator with XRE-family HTH domain/DNA-binding phage protein
MPTIASRASRPRRRSEGADMATASAETPARPLSDALRRAIAASGLTLYAMATASGVDVGTLGRFVRGECGMKLATVDRLFAVLGLRMACGAEAGSDPGPSMPSDALLAAIAASGLGASKLSVMAGVHHQAIRKFMGSTLGLELVSADRLASALGLAVAQGPMPTVPAMQQSGDEKRPILDALLAAIAASGLGAAGLAIATGLRRDHLERLLERRGDVKLAKADRLCEYFGLGFAIVPGELAAVPSEALRVAIKASGLSIRKLAKLSGVVYQSIQGFRVGTLGLDRSSRPFKLHEIPL